MEKAAILKSKQAELLEKLARFKEEKRQRLEKTKAATSQKPWNATNAKKKRAVVVGVSVRGNPDYEPKRKSMSGKPIVTDHGRSGGNNRRHTLASKPSQPKVDAVSTSGKERRRSIDTNNRRHTLASKPSQPNVALVSTRPPLKMSQVAQSNDRQSLVTKTMKTNQRKTAQPRKGPNRTSFSSLHLQENRKSATSGRSLVQAAKEAPVRRRSFTVTPEEVAASPGLKRPLVLDGRSPTNSAKKRRLEGTADSSRPVAPSAEKSKEAPCPTATRSPTAQSAPSQPSPRTYAAMSMRDKLALWKKTKEANKTRVPSTQSRKPLTVTNKSGSAPKKGPTGSTSAPQRKMTNQPSKVQKPVYLQAAKKVNTKDQKTAPAGKLQAGKLQAPGKPAPQSSTKAPTRGKLSSRVPTQTASRDDRRKSCPAPNKVTDGRLDVVSRRKSYAASLISQTRGSGPVSTSSRKTSGGAAGRRSPGRQVAVVGPCVSVSGPSDNNINTEDVTKQVVKPADPSPKPEKHKRRSVRFKTPSSNPTTPVTRTPGRTPSHTPSILRRAPNTPRPDTTDSDRLPWTPVAAPRMTPVSKEMTMREKLYAWLLSRGRTPSRYHQLLCLGDELTSGPLPGGSTVQGGLSVGQLSRQQATLSQEVPPASPGNHGDDPVTTRVTEILTECGILLESDCPPDTVSQWLDQTCQHFEGVQQQAKYWICRAKIAELTQSDSAVISVFEESVRYNAQPPEEIADALKEFVERMSQSSAPGKPVVGNTCPGSPQTPGSRRRRGQSHLLEDNILTSSAIRFCYTETTPFFTKLQSRARRSRGAAPRGTITPVRRSLRLSQKLELPDMLRDHDLVVDSLDLLEEDQKVSALYTPNRALAVQLSDHDDDNDCLDVTY